MERPFPASRGDEPCIFVSCAHENPDRVHPEIQWIEDQSSSMRYDDGVGPVRRRFDGQAP